MPGTPTQLPSTCPLTPLLSPQGSRQVSSWVTVSGTCLLEEIHRSEQLRTGEGGPVEALLQGRHSDHGLQATGGPMPLQRKGACALRGWHPASGENFFTRIPRKNGARWGQGREVTAKGLWSLPSMELGAGEIPRSDCSLEVRCLELSARSSISLKILQASSLISLCCHFPY